MTCSGCGFDTPADFAFCPKCGARLAAAPSPSPPVAPDGDRRPVTVLFADLAGFTALSEGLDPEDVRAIQNDLFREMSASIERYEGFVRREVRGRRGDGGVRRPARTRTIPSAACARPC